MKKISFPFTIDSELVSYDKGKDIAISFSNRVLGTDFNKNSDIDMLNILESMVNNDYDIELLFEVSNESLDILFELFVKFTTQDIGSQEVYNELHAVFINKFSHMDSDFNNWKFQPSSLINNEQKKVSKLRKKNKNQPSR